MSEVDWVVSVVFELAGRGEPQAMEAWKQSRIARLARQAEVRAFSLPSVEIFAQGCWVVCERVDAVFGRDGRAEG
jgi:hypothetical protein